MNLKKGSWSRFEKRNIKYYLQGAFAVVTIMWGWGYLSLLNSEVYDFSRNYISSSPQITSALGKIKSTRLGFSNFRRNYSSGVSTVHFNIVAVGEKKKGTIFLSLKKSGSGWSVEEEKLDVEQ